MTTEQDEDKAFEQGFNSVTAEAPDQDTPEPAANEPSAPATQAADQPTAAQTDEARADQPKPGESAEPVVDPFAALPKEVRDILARVPQMEADLAQTRRVANMVPALQSRLDKLSQQSAADPAPGSRVRLERVQALREQGLPEIADALEELAAATMPKARDDDAPASGGQPAAQAADPAADPQQEVLDDLRPTWGEDLSSSDFQLWLARQEPAYRNEVQSTGKAAVILKALGKFDAFRQQAGNPPTNTPTQARQPNAVRSTRMAAAVLPQGDGRRSRVVIEDDEDAAFNSGFAAIRGTR